MTINSPVLVVSMNTEAPDRITSVTMPSLTSLAREGASCFGARSLVEAQRAVPTNTAMLRGVHPDTHRASEHSLASPQTDSPSFLKHARESGRVTAAFVDQLRIGQAIELDGVDQRFVVDGETCIGHDRRSVEAALRALQSRDCDLLFVYLTEQRGSRQGADSVDDGRRDAEFDAKRVEAARRMDTELGRLLDAAGPDTAVLVTTAHGANRAGFGASGTSNGFAGSAAAAAVPESYVVVREPARVVPGSAWVESRTIDIAPTVADLCGLAPASGWEGVSLLGQQRPLADMLYEMLAQTADVSYGERVTMLEHALQSAALARAAGEGDEMVIACLLHDIGHLIGDAGDWGLPSHAEAAATSLQQVLSPGIVEPIRLHVAAKRYRVAVEPDYYDRLSEASQMSLLEQGGALSPDEAERFGTLAFADEAMRLRAYDDDGKVDGVEIPPLESYRDLLAAALTAKPAIDPAWARDACRCPECRDEGNDQHLIDATELSGWTVIRSERRDDELRILLHHESGERHTALVGPDPAAQISVEPWPCDFVDQLRSMSSRHDDDIAAFGRQLATYGLALMRDCGTEQGTVVDVGQAIGFIRETNYGRLFDVRAEPDPVNLAYTPVGLPAHTDNPYREPCPSVQLLHCLQSASSGGASRFVDGYAAAAALRHEEPEAFEVLTSTDMTFRYHGDGVDLRAQRPLIELDRSGQVRAISVNNRSMEPATLSPAASSAFYKSYQRFVGLLDQDDFAIEITLQPGELVAFDNRRTLHGRRGFRDTEPRHLQGCYIDMDAVRSAALAPDPDTRPTGPLAHLSQT